MGKLPKKRTKTAGMGQRKKQGLLGQKDLMSKNGQPSIDLKNQKSMQFAKEGIVNLGVGSLGLSHQGSTGH